MKKQPLVATVEQRRTQWLKGVLDLCVLARLMDGEAYGYELAKGLEAAGLGEIKGGTLYPLLNRLERDGLVETMWRDSRQGPDRKYYQITNLGESALGEAGDAWGAFVAAARWILGESPGAST
ncbi:MAG: PadR family transcriptional regulator [Acidimicrobiia bacterium]